jgi:hypothetical protein
MAIKSSGQLSFSEIVAEFSDTAPHSMSEFYRGAGKVPSNNTNVPASGAVSFSNFYNAVNRIVLNYTFSTNTTDSTINVTSLPGYVAGITDIIITVNSGVYVYATSTGNAGLTISGSTSSGDTVHLINNGFIIGRGGSAQGWSVSNAAGRPGGPALNILTNMSITNNSYIAGGGGSGGAGMGGGGAGGGNGGDGLTAGTGGAGGGPGQAGANGSQSGRVNGVGGGAGGSGAGGDDYSFGAGGGGGRILPGVGGVGGGGSGGSANNPGGYGSNGGGGGGWGASGGNGGVGSPPLLGGAGGQSVILNGRTVTWLVTGTRWGAIN